MKGLKMIYKFSNKNPEPNPENCENPEELETETAFRLDDIQLSASDRSTTLHPNA
ncbi:MAG: hypothetical protein WCY77_11765 [Weeksellaceae bacterium]